MKKWFKLKSSTIVEILKKKKRLSTYETASFHIE
jgi:hypothetical protein